MLGQILSDMSKVDMWLDENSPELRSGQPLAQDWARIAKISEEVGEVVQAFMLHTGSNPRKGKGENMDAVLCELTDVIYTAILAMLHFTKDPALVGRYMADANVRLSKRMIEDKSRRAHERAMQRVAPSQRALDAQKAWVAKMTQGVRNEIDGAHSTDPNG